MQKTNQPLHNPLELQMLTALELFHYAYRFRGNLFAISYDADVDFEQTITDLRVLETTHINTVLILRDTPNLRDKLNQWNTRGSRYLYIPYNAQDQATEPIEIRVKGAIYSEQIAVVAVKDDNDSEDDTEAFRIASRLKADKLFFVTSQSGLQVHKLFYSHPSPEEIEHIIAKGQGINIGLKRLRMIQEERRRSGFEVVLIGCESGALFEEIFTHRGRGTLFSDRYPNVLRRAIAADAKDIALLIKAHVAEELILPISEQEIFRTIENFFVYSVNGAVVACAKLSDFGDWVELAKFCTLPRYQRRGRAHELGQRMIEEARAQGKKYVFALSILPKMWDFFERLGLKEIDRNALPEGWQKNYDFSRPSKAMFMKLSD